MKAIVIREPYVSLILAGEKTWEMRKATCRYRGPVALIAKGSGTVVGTAEIVDSLPPIETSEAYAEAEPKHCVPPSLQQQAFTDGWRTPWVLTNAHQLASPVPYRHPFGAVIWVTLAPAVAENVRAQALQEVSAARSSLAPSELLDSSSSRESSGFSRQRSREAMVSGDSMRRVTITGGNLRNNHIYLPLDFFPVEAVGGSSKSELAKRMITVVFRPGQKIETDIDGTKRILRARSATGQFFAAAGVAEGDVICITKIDAFGYQISKDAND